jgi:hypothetical protein
VRRCGRAVEVGVNEKPTMTYGEPAVLWRLRHKDGDRARATLIPGAPESTLVYFVNDAFERGENFAEWDAAIRQADEVRARMLTEGWKEE